jgi:predicted enzyme related to lactoylglutathione lyase
MPNPVTHFEIIGKDGKKLQDFYAKLFGWHIDANNPMNYGLVDTNAGKGIAGGIGPGDPNYPGGTTRVTVYAEVDDLAATLKKAESLGAKTIMPPSDVPGGPSIAMFTDPEGNIFGLTKGM